MQSTGNSGGIVVLKGGIREVARRLNKSERQVYRDAKAGKLPFVARIGAGYVIPMAAWERWQQDPQGFAKSSGMAGE